MIPGKLTLGLGVAVVILLAMLSASGVYIWSLYGKLEAKDEIIAAKVETIGQVAADRDAQRDGYRKTSKQLEEANATIASITQVASDTAAVAVKVQQDAAASEAETDRVIAALRKKAANATPENQPRALSEPARQLLDFVRCRIAAARQGGDAARPCGDAAGLASP